MIEHPLQPFLPAHAKILVLGSFPPPQNRWCMQFYYPNYNNDMWRIMGLIAYNDADYFCLTAQRKFNREAILRFCADRGIALYDTASAVIRQKDNASDKFLEIVQPADIGALLNRLPECRAIVCTGQKASASLARNTGSEIPAMGEYLTIERPRPIRFYRMPSTSRAYPMRIEKKALYYRKLFEADLCAI